MKYIVTEYDACVPGGHFKQYATDCASAVELFESLYDDLPCDDEEIDVVFFHGGLQICVADTTIIGRSLDSLLNEPAR